MTKDPRVDEFIESILVLNESDPVGRFYARLELYSMRAKRAVEHFVRAVEHFVRAQVPTLPVLWGQKIQRERHAFSGAASAASLS